jgi:transposase
MMQRLPSKVADDAKPPKEKNPRKTPWRNEPPQLRDDLYRAFGVDLTQVPGINTLTAQMLLTEVGPDLSRFATAAAFCSWLRLCPEPNQNQWRAGTFIENSAKQEPRRFSLTHGSAGASPKPELPRRLLPPDEGSHGYSQSHDRSRTQACSHRLPHDHDAAGYDATIFQHQERRTQDRKRAKLYAQAKELRLQLIPAEAVP